MHGDKKITQMFHGDKEIIRAYQGDSLVFRSRLIEGEDYERKGWLQSNGGFVDLNYKPIPKTIRLETQYRYVPSLIKKGSLSQISLMLCGSREETNGGSRNTTAIWGITTEKCRFDILQDTNKVLYSKMSIVTNKSYTITANNNTHKGTIENETISPTSYSNKSASRYNVSFHIFGGNVGDTHYQSGNHKGGLEISYFKIWEGSTQVFDLIPVILTKNIPAQFDGNNKARNTGDVGLFNLIDGKFYGNSDPTYKLLVRN